jgi:cell division protein FtsN
MPRLTTRDYKRSSRGPGASRLREFALGVLVGAALASAAFLIAGAHARHRAAASAHAHSGVTSQSDAPATAAPDAGSGGGTGTATRTGGSGSAPSSPQTASSAAQAPQYDFYRMLPRLDVPVPHAAAHGTPAPKPAAAQPARPSGSSGPSYILQVGSYLRSAEAEQVRARLARVGLNAEIDRVVAGSRTWHRVRIGPVSGAALARARAQLQTANLHALTIRVGP